MPLLPPAVFLLKSSKSKLCVASVKYAYLAASVLYLAPFGVELGRSNFTKCAYANGSLFISFFLVLVPTGLSAIMPEPPPDLEKTEIGY